MKKKGFLLLVGLFVLLAAACATTSSTPSVTTSAVPKDEQSASADATPTPGDQYQVLIGEWRGPFTGGFFKSGFIGTLKIHEIDIAKAKARCTFDIRGSEKVPAWENMEIRADFIPGPSPKLKWKAQSNPSFEWEIVLKNNLLEGALYQRAMFGAPSIVSTTTMEKYLKK